jgi:D-lactate dehydrogenase
MYKHAMQSLFVAAAMFIGGVALTLTPFPFYSIHVQLFFEDFTGLPPKERMKAWDAKWKILETLPQVLVTPHIAFLTKEALANIADTTVGNLKAAALGQELVNEIKPRK